MGDGVSSREEKSNHTTAQNWEKAHGKTGIFRADVSMSEIEPHL
jgi:hypothetical protein